MKAQLLDLKEQALYELDQIQDGINMDKFRITYLGKKGLITSMMKQLGSLPPEERPGMGKLANQVKADLEIHIELARTKIEAAATNDK